MNSRVSHFESQQAMRPLILRLKSSVQRLWMQNPRFVKYSEILKKQMNLRPAGNCGDNFETSRVHFCSNLFQHSRISRRIL